MNYFVKTTLRQFGFGFFLLSCGFGQPAEQGSGAPPSTAVPLQVEPGHPWTAPFGLGRVGRPMEAVVEVEPASKLAHEYVLVSFRNGQEIGRQVVKFAEPANAKARTGRVVLEDWPEEVVLVTKRDAQAEPVELARAPVRPPAFDAEAAAHPESVINPVDLGTVFVPADWLLLAGGQKAEVEVAALDRSTEIIGAAVAAWYESAPDEKIKAGLTLNRGTVARQKLALGPCSKVLKRDTLHVAIVDDAGKAFWTKDIPVMLIPQPASWPKFGAVETKLRYDAPIPVANGQPVNYDQGWDPKRKEVGVFFPNGARWVFWRGASYCPFWAGRSSTGFCYEWAEILTGAHMVGRRDCVEPLQDKELRYGRVEVVESTAARVHLRWSYQSCDLDYRVWGDFAVEDYFFYPDGLGTRVLTLTAHPDVSVETGEFIVFTPPSGYPFDYLPANVLDILWPGGKAAFRFPIRPNEQPEAWAALKGVGQDVALMHRIWFGRDEKLAAIQYSPWGSWHDLPGFSPFYDRGALVTPAYWGCHWPLSRGFPTGWGISDRIHDSPGHNSFMHSGTPRAFRSETGLMRDALGKSIPMTRQSWAWLIGMTGAGDEELRRWAQSYGNPPKLDAQGASIEGAAAAPERRALCLTVKQKSVSVTITPAKHCMNPVFELKNAPKTLRAIRLNDQALATEKYRWDGATLWLEANLDRPTTLGLEFEN
jgi:hypothetical protein